MKKQFLKRYRRYSEEKLMAIIVRKEAYQAEAIQAAKEELQRRNLDVQVLDDLHVSSLEQMEQEKASLGLKKREPLATWQILVFLLIPFAGLFWALIAYMNYDKQGYQRKARQCFLLILAGLGVAILFFYLISRMRPFL